MKNRYVKKVLPLLLCMVVLAGCSKKAVDAEATKQEGNNSSQTVKKKDPGKIEKYKLRDRDAIYAYDDDTSVVTMYLTVSRGNAAENTDHTWDEINSYSVYDYEQMGVDRYQVNGILQVGDENGPKSGEIGYGEEVPNVTVNVRGQTSSREQQKNYKIKLKEEKGLWRGQRTINLNKHQNEGLRFRNKLMYDLMKQVPQIVSLKTQFVHLYVKDETEGAADSFQDYGLYTQVEQLNKTGLKNHGLDSNGQLYKINFFEFYQYEDVIKMEEDPDFNKEEFEKLLEIKGNTDHTKLIDMLEELNDFSIPTDKILDKYFDSENIAYWMGFMMLTGNYDTDCRNVYLYSPLHSNKWYFIPWDNDSALKQGENENLGYVDGKGWQAGISNYWGNVLFKRCLKSEKFREELDAAVEDLKSFLTAERINSMADTYRKVVKPYVYRMPDEMNAPLDTSEYDEVAKTLSNEVKDNYYHYKDSLEKPMPFYIGVPTIEDGKLHITWEGAFDFQAEDITYTVELASDYLFQNVIFEKSNVKVPEVTTTLPDAGQYFVRVRAKNESGKEQDALDYYVTDSGKNYSMKCFYIRFDGTVKEDVYEE